MAKSINPKHRMEDPKPLGQLLPTNINLKEKEDINYEDEEAVNEHLQIEFPDIKPTALEFFNGKLAAYKAAAFRIETEAKQKRADERKKLILEPWDALQMSEQAMITGKAIGLQFGFDFVIDEYNQKAFDLLCLYFSGDPAFEDHEFEGMQYSLDKGIWLQSPTRGTGKSVLLKAFFKNKRSIFTFIHTTEMATKFQKAGFEAIDHLIEPIGQIPSSLNFYQKQCGVMYDELFGEEKVMHMGSPLSISSYIISKLYDFSTNQRSNRFMFHCTSNSDGNDIETIAGKTYRSRMPELFNLIKLDGPNRRLKTKAPF